MGFPWPERSLLISAFYDSKINVFLLWILSKQQQFEVQLNVKHVGPSPRPAVWYRFGECSWLMTQQVQKVTKDVFSLFVLTPDWCFLELKIQTKKVYKWQTSAQNRLKIFYDLLVQISKVQRIWQSLVVILQKNSLNLVIWQNFMLLCICI